MTGPVTRDTERREAERHALHALLAYLKEGDALTESSAVTVAGWESTEAMCREWIDAHYPPSLAS